MVTPHLPAWQQALKIFLDYTYKSCSQQNMPYILTGSAATAIQHCPLIPGDIDILAKNPETVDTIAELMVDFECDEFPSDDIELWCSSKKSRVFIIDNKEQDEMWHMGRWFVKNVKIEVAFMVSQSTLDESREANYIWENGPDMYPYTKKISFFGYDLNVIPLEIQLTTNLLRNLPERVSQIVDILRKEGYSDSLLRRALTPDQYDDIKFQLNS